MKTFKGLSLVAACTISALASANLHAADTTRLIITKNPDMPNTFAANVQMAQHVQNLPMMANSQAQHVRNTWDGNVVVSLDRSLNSQELNSMIASLEGQPDIESVTVDRLMFPTLTPNDPRYSEQWHYKNSQSGISADIAWDTTAGAGVNVAVLDTGVIYHSDLAPNLVGGYDFVSSPSMARDGDGRDSDASDPGDGYNGGGSSWHGTHVAGTIGAVTNNNQGVAGVAYDAKIVPVRVLGAGGGWEADIADAIVWSAGGYVAGVPTNNHPAQVINMSLGGAGPCGSVYQNAINQAVSLGSTVVVAAGNSSVNVNNATPANCDNIISVAATNSTGSRASFSNYGNLVDIAAPGVNILSTHNTGYNGPGSDSYSYMSGTSMAAPHIAGVVALMYASGSATTPAEIEAKLKSTAKAFPGNCYGCGVGIADASAAIGGGSSNQAPVVSINGPYSGSAGSAVNFSSNGSYDPDGSIAQYSWSFGDGSTSSQANPSHRYQTNGNYTVSLTLTDDRGQTSTKTTTANIGQGDGGGDGGDTLQNNVPVSGLAANRNQSISYTFEVPSNASNLRFVMNGGTGDADLYTRFGSSPTDSLFECRPYQNGNNEVCEVAAPQAGTWHVKMKAYRKFSGVSLTASYSTSGAPNNELPVADAGGPYYGQADQYISFTGSNSYDPDGQITTYRWDFGDGNSSSQANPRHRYAGAGEYNVTLTVSDNEGGSDSRSTTAVIEGGATQPGNLENACLSQSPQDYVNIQNQTPVCVTSGSGNPLYFYFYTNGTNQATIRTEHGSGNADIYYSNSTWPSTGNYVERSIQNGNTESINLGSLAAGYHYIMVDGNHSGLTLQVDMQ